VKNHPLVPHFLLNVSHIFYDVLDAEFIISWSKQTTSLMGGPTTSEMRIMRLSTQGEILGDKLLFNSSTDETSIYWYDIEKHNDGYLYGCQTSWVNDFPFPSYMESHIYKADTSGAIIWIDTNLTGFQTRNIIVYGNYVIAYGPLGHGGNTVVFEQYDLNGNYINSWNIIQTANEIWVADAHVQTNGNLLFTIVAYINNSPNTDDYSSHFYTYDPTLAQIGYFARNNTQFEEMPTFAYHTDSSVFLINSIMDNQFSNRSMGIQLLHLNTIGVVFSEDVLLYDSINFNASMGRPATYCFNKNTQAFYLTAWYLDSIMEYYNTVVTKYCIDSCLSNQYSHSTYHSYNIYPNPSSGSFIINSPENIEGPILVYDVFGKIIGNIPTSGNTNSVEFNLNINDSGLYFVKTKYWTGKVFLQK
jgi:hypothetical protein